MTKRHRYCTAMGLFFLSEALLLTGLPRPCCGQRQAAPSNTATSGTRILVAVNGQPISEGDLDVIMLVRGVPEESKADARKTLLELLIDQRLLQAYLAGRKAKPNPRELDAQVEAIRELIRRRGSDPQKLLASFGYTEETLRKELALPLAWKAYVDRNVKSKQLREYWQQHHQEFDGTEVRAAHIVIKVDTKTESPELAAAEAKLKQVHADILAGKVTFADAARQHSDAPSRDSGGDVGFFPYRFRMPAAFSKAAFPLEIGKISVPFRSPFGVHILTVTERRPGQLSLEDARAEVLERLSDDMRRDVIRTERTKASIDWKVSSQGE